MPLSLPAEVLLLIIEALEPPPSDAQVALPPSHPITKSLVALSLVCRATYPAALRILLSRCLYIDSAARLSALLYCLRQHEARLDNAAEGQRWLPLVRVSNRIQSLYLAPFPSDTVNVPAIATDVQDLFAWIAPSLRTLVIDMPLRSLRPPEDYARVRPTLRNAFAQLTQLESFCSVRDELYLNCKSLRIAEVDDEAPVWSLWPRLRLLALYNPDFDNNDWQHHLSRLPNLQTFVATRADGLSQTNVYEMWVRYSAAPAVRCLLVNTWNDHVPFRGSSIVEPDECVQVYEVCVPISYYGDENPITTCQDWVKAAAIRRDLEAQPVRH